MGQEEYIRQLAAAMAQQNAAATQESLVHLRYAYIIRFTDGHEESWRHAKFIEGTNAVQVFDVPGEDGDVDEAVDKYKENGHSEVIPLDKVDRILIDWKALDEEKPEQKKLSFGTGQYL